IMRAVRTTCGRVALQLGSELWSNSATLRFRADIDRRDAERQRLPNDLLQTCTPQQFGEGFALRELADRGRQIVVRRLLIAHQQLSNERQHVAEVPQIERSKKPARRR